MKIRYFLKQTQKPINERLDAELVYAEVSNRFGNEIDGVKKYSKFQFSLDTYVKPHHFGTIKTKRGASNFIYDTNTIQKHSQSTADTRQAILTFENAVTSTRLYFRNIATRPTKDEFKNYLETIIGRDKGLKKTLTFVNYLTKRIAHFESLAGTGDPYAKSPNTIQNYGTLLTLIINYELVRNKVVTFENIKDLYSDLWVVADELIKGKYKLIVKIGDKKKPINPNGIATNTVVAMQSNLRDICKDAINDNIKVSLDVTNSKLIHKIQKSSRQYSINNSDLLTIYNHVPTTERLQTAKDYIIFSSLAGMRLQSVLQVVGNSIQRYDKNGKAFDYVYTVQSKTLTECHTPLFKPAKDVIVRNGGTLPNFSKHSATLNKQIKDLFKEAGLTYFIPVTKHYFVDGKVTTNESVSSIVSSHCTRKAFITNLYEFGINTTTSELVTHPERKPSGTADSYNKITNDVRAVRFYDEVTRNITNNELYCF